MQAVQPPPGASTMTDTARDVESLRADFPLLSRSIGSKPLAYLDNAATTQKPQCVIDALAEFYSRHNANVHRGVHHLSQQATDDYEATRAKVARFIGAADVGEIVFVRGATEAINLVAQTFGREQLGMGDEILISAMEHHSNIVPWQMVCQQTGAELRVIPIDSDGDLVLEELERLLSPRTRLLAVTHVSNALGTVNPLAQIVEMAHAHDVCVLVDGAQGAPHLPVDVQELGCDFYAFSGHKLYGPTGIGVLYGRRQHLEAMPPYQGGGDMILSVTFEETIYNCPPHKFEAGTPNVAGAIGLGAAVDYLQRLDFEAVMKREDELLDYAMQRLRDIPRVRFIGEPQQRTSVLSFLVEDIHPHDVGTILDSEGVAIRAGHHCAQPVMERFGVPATARASLSFYNNEEDIDALVRGIHRAIEVLG